MILSIPTLQFTDFVVFLTCGVVLGCCWLLRRDKVHHLFFGASFLVCAVMSVWFVDFGRYGSVWSPLGWSAAGMLFWVGLRLFDGRPAMTRYMAIFAVLPTGVHVVLDLAGFGPEAINTGSTIAYAVHEAAVAAYVLSTGVGQSPIRKVIGGSLAMIGVAICLPLLPVSIWSPEVPIVSIFVVDQVSSILLTTAILALEAEKAHAALARQALHDPLTGALNRAGLMRITETDDRASGVVVVDLDHFKRINDRYGHAAGDHVLVRFAKRAESILPVGGRLARFGGEEFVMILPGHDRIASTLFAERLRLTVSRMPIDWNGDVIWLSVSVGVAWADRGISVPAAVEQADKAMYAAKANGRDQVRVA